jgi:hypothetical protein
VSEIDDLRKKLADAGIPTGTWTRTDGGTRPLPPSVLRQKELLTKLRDLLQGQVDRDKAKLAELYETVSRLNHGGGS